MKLKEKVAQVGAISKDVEYLRDQYFGMTLWGSCPDGDVKFDDLIQWLFDNQHDVEHMISVANKIEELSKSK